MHWDIQHLDILGPNHLRVQFADGVQGEVVFDEGFLNEAAPRQG